MTEHTHSSLPPWVWVYIHIYTPHSTDEKVIVKAKHKKLLRRKTEAKKRTL